MSQRIGWIPDDGSTEIVDRFHQRVGASLGPMVTAFEECFVRFGIHRARSGKGACSWGVSLISISRAIGSATSLCSARTSQRPLGADPHAVAWNSFQGSV